MAYEVSGSIAAGNVVSTFVPARANTWTRGGVPSPNGAKIAAASSRHGGAGSDDYGIDFWHSGSSGWEEAESVDTGANLPYAILWYDDNILFSAESDNKLRSYTSGSGGWTALERASLRSYTNQHMFWSPGKTRLITTNNNLNAPSNDDYATVLTSGSTTWGAFIMGNSIVQAKIGGATWASENDLIIGMPEYNSSAGMIKHLRYDGSSDWNEVSRSVGFNSNSSNTKQLGTMVYYNTGSNELLIGANTENDTSPVINVIQSSSEGYFPAAGSNLHLVGSPIRTVIDHSAMGIASADYPPDGLRGFNGLSLFPDRSDGNRFFVHTTANSTPYDDTVYAIVESGSSGYRFSQLENNAIMGGGASEYSSGLSDGSTLYVAHGTGAVSILGFTVYENILSGIPAGFTLSQSATPLDITEGATGTVGVALNKQPSRKTQADNLPRKIHFEPSTIETIDRSVLSYMNGLNLFADTNEGWRKVPIIWGTAERAFQVKHNKDIRDQQGMLKLPIISIKRSSLTKDMSSKGVFQGNVPAVQDEQGGSLSVGRMIYQDKTTKFANADAARLHDQDNYPRVNHKVVYRTVMAPMPVNVSVMYDITIRTEYQQQMNNLMLPFITSPGTINYIRLLEGEHR